MRAEGRAALCRAYHLLVHNKAGKVQYAVDVSPPVIPLPPVPPCHPGCFPAGTAIHVPGGTKPIESVREGDLVTTVGTDGVGSSAKVVSVFVTRNRLVEVRTEAGSLLTTETQPFSLASGGLRAVGELEAGDRICPLERQRVPARNGAVRVGYRPGRGRFQSHPRGSAIFLANGFLVRSKPPAPASPGRTRGRGPLTVPAP